MKKGIVSCYGLNLVSKCKFFKKLKNKNKEYFLFDIVFRK